MYMMSKNKKTDTFERDCVVKVITHQERSELMVQKMEKIQIELNAPQRFTSNAT